MSDEREKAIQQSIAQAQALHDETEDMLKEIAERDRRIQRFAAKTRAMLDGMEVELSPSSAGRMLDAEPLTWVRFREFYAELSPENQELLWEFMLSERGEQA